MLADAHFMQRQYDRATQLLMDAINSGVNAPAVRTKLATYYRFQGRFEDASQQYYLILARHSGNAEARMDLTRSLIRQGHFSQAETVLAEGRSIQPEEYKWSQQLANLWLNRSGQPVKTRYDKALDFALEANNKSDGNIETTVLVMSVFIARAEYQRCQDFYSTQVPKDQKDQYRVLLPLAWAKAGRWRQGKTGILPTTSTELARLQSKAVDLFHQVLDKSGDNDDIESYVVALKGLLDIRGLENVIQSTRDTFSSDPQNPRIRILLATLLNRRARQRMRERQTSMAKEDLNQAIDLLNPLVDEPNLSVPLRLGIYNQLATSYTALKMDQQATDVYLKLLKLKPNDIRALNNLAYILSDMLNKPKEALPYIERALRQNPKEANLLDTYGWILFKAGEFNRAVVQLGLSVDIQPTAVNHYHLGAALKEAGESQLALRALRESAKLLQSDPANEANIGNEVRTLIEQLEKN